MIGLKNCDQLSEIFKIHALLAFIKQLLDEVEHDIMNYQNLVPVLSAEAEGFGR